jgi:DNA-binding SARP family transcriptional activator
MARLTLSLLGGFQARLDHGPPLALPTKAQALLAFLALRSGQAQPRGKLGALLWGGTSDEQARSNLRHTLFTIRKAVGVTPPPPLISEGQLVTFSPASVDVDVAQFEALVRDGRPEALERAAALYQGDLLDGLGVSEPPFEEWLLTERERLRELALEALARLLVHERKAGLTQQAIQTATRLLALDPLQEAVHRDLMRLYARQGRRASALRQYRTCADVLKRELGVEPELETRQLYDEILERRAVASPATLDVVTEARPRQARPHLGGTLEGERKHITVLFADLCGTAEHVLDRDPEEASRLLEPLIERMIGAVRPYGGTVHAVLGDGITALFGAPRAQEDHAVRACYAALSLRETITRYAAEVCRARGLDLSIRVGLHSGEVVVRSVEGDLQADPGAMAQITHLAARMEQMASPGTIRLTAETQRLVDGFLDSRSLGRLAVTGGREPVEVFEVVRAGSARTRLHVALDRGLTRFVGRESEIAQLTRAAETARTGRGRVVAVIGEPGVGKSRLLHELTHVESLRGWRLLDTRGFAYGTMMSYLPVIALLRSYLWVEDRDTPRDIADKLTRTVLSLDPALTPSLPALAALLDVPVDDREWPRLDPPLRRRRTLDAVKQLLLRASQEQPLALLFEDLHWIDGESQALLDGLVETLSAAPLLMVVTYRPEYEHGWANKSQYTQLRLETLPAPEANAMLDALLGDDESLDSLKPMLTARAGGNPLFLEETVHALVETGALEGERGAYRLTHDLATVRVPATVQAVLAARIDRLPAADKRLLHTAAVIGMHVPFTLLQAVADLSDEDLHERLAHLQDAELLYQASLLPDLEYAFKHPLTHEVAYDSLLQERRRSLHVRIVEALDRLYVDRVAEQVERLAHHAVRAELREKAVRYLRQAGAKAAARSALADARAWFEQALGVLDRLPETPSTLEQAFEIRCELWQVLLLSGEPRRTLALLGEAESLATRLRDDRRRARVCAVAITIHTQLGELDQALEAGTRALELARGLDDLNLITISTSYLAQLHYHRGDYQRVVELARKNLAALPHEWLYEYRDMASPGSVYDRCWLVMSLAELGRFAEAAEDEAEAIRLAEEMRLAEPTPRAAPIGLAHFGAGMRHLLKGDWPKARDLIERWISVVKAANVGLHVPIAVAASAWALAQLGETREALARLGEGEALLERQVLRGFVGNLGWVFYSLGRASLLLGRLDDARRLGDRAIELSPSHPGFAAQALHLLGDIAAHPDRFDAERSEGCYREALALAATRGMRPLVAHCHLGLATVHARCGRSEEARLEMSAAMALYQEMHMIFWLHRAEAALAQTV